MKPAFQPFLLLSLITLSLPLGLPLCAQTAKKAKQPPRHHLAVRVVAVGESPPPQYKLETIQDGNHEGYHDSNDKKTRRGRKNQMPVMLPENPNHYPPRPLYVPIDKQGNALRTLFLTPGSQSVRFSVFKKEKLPIIQKEQSDNQSGKKKPQRKNLMAVKVPARSNDVLILLTKKPNTLSWKNFSTHVLDISPEVVPASHLYIINMSRHGVDLLNRNGQSTGTIQPGQKLLSKKIQPRKKMNLRLAGINKKEFLKKTFRASKSTRRLIIIHDLLKPKPTGETQGYMVINETVEMPSIPSSLKKDLQEHSQKNSNRQSLNTVHLNSHSQ